MKVLALDLGTSTGVAYHNPLSNGAPIYSTWKLSPRPATKTRAAEVHHARLGKLWDNLQALPFKPDLLAIEEAQGFTRSKSAVESSHQYRAVVLLWALQNDIRTITVNPGDLCFFSLGKRACKRDEKKRETILKVNSMGFEVRNDDEADALMILFWAIKYYGERVTL